MNSIKKIIEEMEADLLSAERDFARKNRHGFSSARLHEGVAGALKKYIPKLKLLKDKTPPNPAQPYYSNLKIKKDEC